MRIAIFGAGAVGGTIAALLARAGFKVSVIARGQHLAAIQHHGLRLETPDEAFVVKVIASDDASQLGQQDLVICTLKAYSQAAVASDLASLLGDDTPVVFAQNGIPWWYFANEDNPEYASLRNLIGLQRVIGCVVECPAKVISPGVIRLSQNHLNFFLGEPNNVLTPRLQKIKSELQDALPITLTTQIQVAIWNKLRINVASSLLTTLTHSFTRDVLNNPALNAQFLQLLAETRAVAAAYGVSIDEADEGLLARFYRQKHAPSMLQDLLAHRPMEIDVQLKSLQTLAHKAGVNTPLLDILLPLLQQRVLATAESELK